MIRLRLSLTDEQWALFQDAGKILSLDPKVVLLMSASIGYRILDMSVIHPVNVGIAKAMDERLDEGKAALEGDLSKVLDKGKVTGENLHTEKLPSQSKKGTQHKKKSLRGK